MLLDEIIDLATDDKQPIATLLRKCIILGHRLKNEQLTTWANKELNGYIKDDPLPDYRKVFTPSEGIFTGIGQSQTKALIPPSSLEERHRSFAESALLSQGISVYEQAVQGEKKPPKSLGLRIWLSTTNVKSESV